MGESLGSLSVKELKNLESRLEKGISRIRSKKVYIITIIINIICNDYKKLILIVYVAATLALKDVSLFLFMLFPVPE